MTQIREDPKGHRVFAQAGRKGLLQPPGLSGRDRDVSQSVHHPGVPGQVFCRRLRDLRNDAGAFTLFVRPLVHIFPHPVVPDAGIAFAFLFHPAVGNAQHIVRDALIAEILQVGDEIHDPVVADEGAYGRHVGTNGCHGGKIGAGGLAPEDDPGRVDAVVRGMVVQKAYGGAAVLDPAGERGFLGQPVIDARAGPASVTEVPQHKDGLAGVRVAGNEASAVEQYQQGQRFLRIGEIEIQCL